MALIVSGSSSQTITVIVSCSPGQPMALIYCQWQSWSVVSGSPGQTITVIVSGSPGQIMAFIVSGSPSLWQSWSVVSPSELSVLVKLSCHCQWQFWSNYHSHCQCCGQTTDLPLI